MSDGVSRTARDGEPEGPSREVRSERPGSRIPVLGPSRGGVPGSTRSPGRRDRPGTPGADPAQGRCAGSAASTAPGAPPRPAPSRVRRRSQRALEGDRVRGSAPRRRSRRRLGGGWWPGVAARFSRPQGGLSDRAGVQPEPPRIARPEAPGRGATLRRLRPGLPHDESGHGCGNARGCSTQTVTLASIGRSCSSFHNGEFQPWTSRDR